jgi:hypothetical protein
VAGGADAGEVVRLTVVPDEGAAAILCGLLETEGIECVHRRADLAVGMGDASQTYGGWREILVHRRDLERARELADATGSDQAGDEREAYVVEATLRLEEGTDPREPGAAVTIGLCGAVDHEGQCRWPHNNEIVADGGTASFRTLFVSTPEDAAEVRELVKSALSADEGWTVERVGSREVRPDEEELADRLARAPALE